MEKELQERDKRINNLEKEIRELKELRTKNEGTDYSTIEDAENENLPSFEMLSSIPENRGINQLFRLLAHLLTFVVTFLDPQIFFSSVLTFYRHFPFIKKKKNSFEGKIHF